jgi:hypothetical protein
MSLVQLGILVELWGTYVWCAHINSCSSPHGGYCWQSLAWWTVVGMVFHFGPDTHPNIFSLAECEAAVLLPVVEITRGLWPGSFPALTLNSILSLPHGRSPPSLLKSTDFFICSSTSQSVWKYPYLEDTRTVSTLTFYVSHLPGYMGGLANYHIWMEIQEGMGSWSAMFPELCSLNYVLSDS